ncbi:helix-turn-helix domain-containing protein [Nitrosomonas oligotropha]|uniref:helix-turn-helix domain-containing protein n=1 Tax=Nitrosomonas oligotropha TaxID=42354 RepID=UPI00136B0E06|nr:helix-turn-helix domain-containing protein [Nitrosomonas oligotropha]MXS83649.1 DNA-binding protein [Nitrosomonas oligotropha]
MSKLALIAVQNAHTDLDVAEKSLAVWRCTGRYSIPFYKVGRHVKYRKSDLEAWLESRCRSNGATA